ncbi:MAG: helix-turn-helix domain-containing protein [Acidobacteriota bacterium]|nr:helix-turn-helix domain-containing protein [Acidobacteriota bacterium]
MGHEEELITQKEAADLRGVSLGAINELVRRGKLLSEERFGKRLVYRSDVEAYEPSPGGWPKGKPRGPQESAAKPKGQVKAEKKVAKKRIRKKDPTRLLKTLS